MSQHYSVSVVAIFVLYLTHCKIRNVSSGMAQNELVLLIGIPDLVRAREWQFPIRPVSSL